MTTHTMQFDVKDPDAFCELRDTLGIDDAVTDRLLEFGEYATIEVEVDAEMRIVAARFLPKAKR